jgi:S-DNA-T family DNA segregation ATPase FtsK/SpoIIIE
MAGIAGFAYFKTNGPATNDKEKIQKIFDNSNWTGKNGETIRLHRKASFKGGTEYVYQLPLGFDRKKIESHKHILEDGLNVKQKIEFDPSELLKINWRQPIVKQIRKILTDKKTAKKEIEINFDGMLRIKVYNEQMDNKIDWAESMLKPGTYSVVIGATRDGLIYHDFDKSKHLIIAGVPGSGKSVVMKMIIISLVLSNPNNVVFSLIDLKGGPAFARFRNTKQVKNLGVDNEQAKSILRDVKEEMDNIYKNVLVPNGYEDVSEAGIKKRHFIIVDEAADLASDKEAVELLTDIVRKGRGSGHYVIYATQYPTVQTVASQIKRNIPARLTYVLDSAIASNAVLDTNGAEELPEIPGRGIYKMVKSQIIQTPFISNKDIETLIKPHVIIQARKDGQHGQNGGQATTDRKHSIEFKKI